MANQMTGKVLSVGQIQTIVSKSGNTIAKREIELDCTRFDPYTGERGFENFPMFEFSGDKVAELDNLKINDVVTISFDLVGTHYVGQDGLQKNFTRIRGYKAELKQSAQQVAPAQPIAQQPISQPQYQQPMRQQPQQQQLNGFGGVDRQGLGLPF